MLWIDRVFRKSGLPDVPLPWRRVDIHTARFSRAVELRNSRNVAADRALGEPSLLSRYAAVDLWTFRLEPPVRDVFHQKEEELLLRHGIAIVILLTTAELPKLPMLRLVRQIRVLRPVLVDYPEDVLGVGAELRVVDRVAFSGQARLDPTPDIHLQPGTPSAPCRGRPQTFGKVSPHSRVPTPWFGSKNSGVMGLKAATLQG